jgi:hypothetical protein
MLAYLAVTLAHLGYIDQAHSRLNEALSESCRLRHAYTRALVLLCASWTDAIIGSAETNRYAEELQAISKDSLPTFLAYGTAFRGLSLTRLGEAERGCFLITQGLSMLRATGTALNTPRLLMGIAEAHAMLGQLDEGLNRLAEAERILETTDERANESELHRLRGDLLNVTGERTVAEQAYRQALAERQSAKLFELRAATGLSRLWGQQGKTAEARDLLKPVYSWFTEGLNTRAVEEARAVLRQLGNDGAGGQVAPSRSQLGPADGRSRREATSSGRRAGDRQEPANGCDHAIEHWNLRCHSRVALLGTIKLTALLSSKLVCRITELALAESVWPLPPRSHRRREPQVSTVTHPRRRWRWFAAALLDRPATD